MELELKEYTLTELGKWFGSNNPKYLHRKAIKEKKLEELKEFANYEINGNKIKITEIYVPVYTKPSKIKQNNKFYQDAIIEVIQQSPIQYYKTTAGRIIKNHKEELDKMKHTSFSTSYKYTRDNMKKMFVTEQTHGRMSRKVWCQRFYKEGVDFVCLTQ